MRALMVEMPPSISGLLQHAAAVLHGIGSWSRAQPRSRCTTSCYAQAAVRARCLAKVLERLGSGDLGQDARNARRERGRSRKWHARADPPLLRGLIFVPGGQR
jgi:hypothetical protein